MKISSVIAEFNPFHNGHEYLIKETKKESDAVICVMSGSFVQRGDVALFDKWTRAKAAVMCGADLIIELPAVYAVSTAERFAAGAVSLIEKLGCADEIVFGSEAGDLKKLTEAAELTCTESPEISKKIKAYLNSGLSFPVARQKAYSGIIDDGILTNPNNILAVEYIKAALKNNCSVKFRTLQRIGDYHSTQASGKYASATALRKFILSGKDISNYIPSNICEIYKSASLYNIDKLNNTIIYLLRTTELNQLREINDVTEGLEYALKKAGNEYSDIGSVISAVSGKRYTKTKISRILISLLLGIDKKIIYSYPSYARILAFNNLGREIIKKINIPTIVKVADFTDNNEMFNIDITATNVASLCSDKNKESGKDYKTSPIYLRTNKT